MVDKFEVYESAIDMVSCELDKMVKAGELTPNTVNNMGAISDIIKDLHKALYYGIMLEEEYYSPNEDSRYRQGSSYRSSYRNTPSRSYGSRMSRNSASDSMLNHLYMAMDNATNEEERKRVKRMIDEIEHNA